MQPRYKLLPHIATGRQHTQLKGLNGHHDGGGDDGDVDGGGDDGDVDRDDDWLARRLSPVTMMAGW